MNFGLDATTAASIWATIALFIFIGVMIYFKVPQTVTKMLDGRIKKIEDELAEAERLRAEAKALLNRPFVAPEDAVIETAKSAVEYGLV